MATAGQLAADITGTVFRDYDADGVRDAFEPGMPGIETRAFDAAGLLVGTPQVTASDGTYTIVGALGTVRIELTIPDSLSFLQRGAVGADSASSVRFASDGAIVDFGVNNPAHYCQPDPGLITNCFVTGDQAGNMDEVLVSFPFTAGNGGNSPLPGVDLPPHAQLASADQIGPTFGLAYQRSSGSIFAGAMMKRHVSFGGLDGGHVRWEQR